MYYPTASERYRAYLHSEHWRLMKNSAKKRKQKKQGCAACRSHERLDLHHMMYRGDPYDTLPGDLIWLCHRCHSLFHETCGVSLKAMPRGLLKIKTVEKIRKVLRKIESYKKDNSMDCWLDAVALDTDGGWDDD